MRLCAGFRSTDRKKTSLAGSAKKLYGRSTRISTLLEKWRLDPPIRYAASYLYAVTNFREWDDSKLPDLHPLSGCCRPKRWSAVLQLGAHDLGALCHRLHLAECHLARQVFQAAVGSLRQDNASPSRSSPQNTSPFTTKLGDPKTPAFSATSVWGYARATYRKALYSVRRYEARQKVPNAHWLVSEGSSE